MYRVAPLLVGVLACGRIGFDNLDGLHSAADSADASAQRTVPAGAKIWLQMETDPAVSIVDDGGHHAATCAMCPTRGAGERGAGYVFDDTAEVDVGDAVDLDASAGFTAAVWLKLSAYATATHDCAWTKGFGGSAVSTDTFGLCFDITGVALFDSDDSVGALDELRGPTLPLGEWHHLAMTWDGTQKHAFVDGTEVGAGTTAIGAGNGVFGLGADRGVNRLDGAVDDALFYTRPLAPAEIQQLALP